MKVFLRCEIPLGLRTSPSASPFYLPQKLFLRLKTFPEFLCSQIKRFKVRFVYQPRFNVCWKFSSCKGSLVSLRVFWTFPKKQLLRGNKLNFLHQEQLSFVVALANKATHTRAILINYVFIFPPHFFVEVKTKEIYNFNPSPPKWMSSEKQRLKDVKGDKPGRKIELRKTRTHCAVLLKINGFAQSILRRSFCVARLLRFASFYLMRLFVERVLNSLRKASIISSWREGDTDAPNCWVKTSHMNGELFYLNFLRNQQT